ncbi:TolC family protein [Lutibacter sp. HS1-25]|uniref:TolC family protein n=1 Tax=Lutibacter sp. HS1-25 TaxID=2485000 RepID=UPI0010116A9F|nr:TolC family protein [Lutibacter sp. HS1-25]RXP44976.1 TolC family protein [Lutibacter sp. HS1-25]
MKNIKPILSLFLILLIQFAQAQEVLNDYLKIAATNNPELKAMFSDYMAAMERVPQVGTLPDPSFAFGYFIQPVETRLGPQKATFNLTQSFPWFGSLGAKKDMASEMAKAKYEAFENSKSNIFFEIKTAYYNYYFIEKAIEITKKNIEILEVFKRLSLVKIETGNASIIDELRVEMEINDLENQLALFLDSKDVLQVSFNNLLNRDEYDEIIVPEVLWQNEIPLNQLATLNTIYASNHQLKSIDHKLNAFINQETAAKKEGLPKFNIGLNYTIVGENSMSTASDNGKDAFVFPFVGVTIPIYRKKYKALIAEAQYLQEAETARKEDKKNTLSTIYKSTYKDFNDGNRRIILNQKQAAIAKKVLDILITSYSTNSTDFEEVLRIERQLLKYELEHQKAIIDKNVAVAFVNYLLGN